MTTLLILFIWTGTRWQFSSIEPISAFDSMPQCQVLAIEATTPNVQAFCVAASGEEA